MSAPRWIDDPNPRDVRIARMFRDWDERNEDLQRLLDYPHSALAERCLELEAAERINLANITRLREERDDLATANLRLRAREYELERELEGDTEGDRWELRHVLTALVVFLLLAATCWEFVGAIP